MHHNPIAGDSPRQLPLPLPPTAEPPAWAIGSSASLQAAADLTGVSEQTIEGWARDGRICTERRQDGLWYRLDDILMANGGPQ